jgi:ABC-type lipoprotein export system ATPase subunit
MGPSSRPARGGTATGRRLAPGEIQRALPGDRHIPRPESTAPDFARSTDETLIRLRHVYKVYRVADTGVVALGGVDLDIARGEFVAVVGPSGAGKSSILNLVGGLDRASAGVVEVDGHDLGRLDDDEMTDYRRDRVGFVWQGTARNLVPYLSVTANVGLPLIARGQAGAGRRRAAELLPAVGLSMRAGHKPDQLSGGEQQRAAIAVALANLPPLLLADEPTAELDTASARAVLDAFRRVNEDFGLTIVMVTHDLIAARRADRTVRVRDGHLVRETHEVARVGEEGLLHLPEEAVAALWEAELEAEVHGAEVRIRPRSDQAARHVGPVASEPASSPFAPRPSAEEQTRDG